jgi:hypothetical protein
MNSSIFLKNLTLLSYVSPFGMTYKRVTSIHMTRLTYTSKYESCYPFTLDSFWVKKFTYVFYYLLFSINKNN